MRETWCISLDWENSLHKVWIPISICGRGLANKHRAAEDIIMRSFTDAQCVIVASVCAVSGNWLAVILSIFSNVVSTIPAAMKMMGPRSSSTTQIYWFMVRHNFAATSLCSTSQLPCARLAVGWESESKQNLWAATSAICPAPHLNVRKHLTKKLLNGSATDDSFGSLSFYAKAMIGAQHNDPDDSYHRWFSGPLSGTGNFS